MCIKSPWLKSSLRSRKVWIYLEEKELYHPLQNGEESKLKLIGLFPSWRRQGDGFFFLKEIKRNEPGTSSRIPIPPGIHFCQSPPWDLREVLFSDLLLCLEKEMEGK